MISTKWRVLLLDTKPGNINHYIALGIEAALRDDPRVEAVHFAEYGDALPTAIRHDCNLFVAFDGEDLDRGLCQRIATVCGTSVLWVTDDPYDREPVNISNAELFDLVFTNDSASVAYYEGKAAHLPFAANPRFNFKEIPERDRGHYLYDVLFIGTAWPNRAHFLRKLINELPEAKFKVALPSNEALPAPDLGLPPSTYGWRVPNSEMCRLANRSRVVLGLHRAFGPAPDRSQASTPGPRLYEIALAGGFQLVDLSLSEAVEYFELGKEIAGFSSLQECRDQIRYFLSCPDLRIEMARAAQARCLAEHLYEHRIRTIIDAVESLPPKRVSVQTPMSATPGRKSRVLYVSHNSVNHPPFGGVEVYVDLLSRSLPDAFEPFHYYPDSEWGLGSGIVCENIRTGDKIRHRFSTPTPWGKVTDVEREQHFAELLHDLQIDLVHFQHLHGFTWSLPLVPRTMGLPVVMTLADHFAACDNYTLLNAARQYCNIPQRPTTACDVCLSKLNGAAAGSAASRRAFVGSVLENIDLTIFLCENARDVTSSLFPSLATDERAWVEGFPLDDRPALARPNTRRPFLKVAVIGNFAFHKGADILCDIFQAMRDDPIEFHVHGDVQPPYEPPVFPNVRVHGAYKPHTLRGPLCDADVGLFLSNWPETYVMTLSEAWRAGVVPIVGDIGALGERVQHGVNGLKVPVNDAGSVVHALRGMTANRHELERMRSNIEPALYCRLDGHVERLTQKYDDLLSKYSVRSRKTNFFKEPPRPRAASAGNVFRMEPVWRRGAAVPHHAVAMVQPNGPATVQPNGSATVQLNGSLIRRVYRFWRSRGVKATVRCSLAELKRLANEKGGRNAQIT